MLDFTNTIFEQVVVHKVGNIARNENLVLAKSPARLNEDVKSLLTTYFLRAFKDPQFYIFDYESNYKDNRVFALVSEIFDDPNSLYQNSTKMANYLFEVADHPNIKGGEFYVVYFKDCMVDDELVDAIGLFKSENKETFLKVYQENDDFTISHDEGININKLDKGCIIFNTEKEFGYKLSIVDKTNKNTEALYWVYDFLKAKQREDNFYQTANYLKMCKGFVEDVFNDDNNIEKTDQFEMLGRSLEYFDDKQEFDMEDFELSVMEQPEIIDAFKEYKKEYVEKYDLAVADDFKISMDAVKKSRKDFKSVLKLDKNFHVYIHGRRDYISKGWDEQKKLNFYKIYYDVEN